MFKPGELAHWLLAEMAVFSLFIYHTEIFLKTTNGEGKMVVSVPIWVRLNFLAFILEENSNDITPSIEHYFLLIRQKVDQAGTLGHVEMSAHVPLAKSQTTLRQGKRQMWE